MQSPPAAAQAAEQPSLFPTSPVLAPPPLIAAPSEETEQSPIAVPGASLLPRRLPPARMITSGDGGPVILGENSGKWKLWDLRSFKSELEFYGEVHNDKQSSKSAPEATQQSTLLRGTTNIAFESYIGHRNFIDLQGNFSLGYEDQKITGTGAEDHTSGPTDFYDISARILGESFAPVTAYSRREELIQSRDFAGTLKTVTWENGAILELKSPTIPTRMQYFHREQTYEDSLGLSNGNSTQDSFALSSSTNIAEHQGLEFNYTFDHVDEAALTTFSNQYDQHQATLSHTYTFGSNLEDSLRSTVSVHDQTGLYGENRIRLDEHLTLIHTQRLRSDYSFTFENLTRGGQEQQQLQGNATVTHKLFDSLASTAQAGGSMVDVPGLFSSTSEFINGSLTYTKRVPLGQLGASAGMGYSHTESSNQGSPFLVFDEPHTFSDPFDVVISRRNIIGTISVTDQAHIPKTEGTDYTVTFFSDRIEIHRQPFGTITNGQTVLVTYQIGPTPGNAIDTFTQNYSLRYTIQEGFFSGLSLYSYLQITSHTIDAVDPAQFTLDDVTDWRYGAEYRIREWNFVLERENHNSTISPYDRTRYQIQFERRFGRDATLAIVATRDEVDYQIDGNHTEYNDLLARWSQRLGSGWNMSVGLEYRDEHNDIQGNTRGLEQSVELNWRWRQTRVFGGFRNAFLTGGDTDRVTQTITFGLTRSF
jgi:hypothetical protein